MGLETWICRRGSSGYVSDYLWLRNTCMDLLCMDLIAFAFMYYLWLIVDERYNVYLHLWISCDYINCM